MPSSGWLSSRQTAAGLEIVPAEFVVDASGKNTRVPEFLDRVGIGAPEVEQDIINCFYSTMQHRVPPERQWQDKVMVICYAYRPFEDTYAAQYYVDSSRTLLSTSLVAYNCYSPPRTVKEFREFANLMPSPVIGENIDGLEAASPIYNFRYPNMLRLHYEKKRNLPRALVAVGDSYTSADPVSGLGMTLALKEVREMQLALAKYGPGHPDLPRSYYRSIAKMADTAWFVIREQNLRFPWLKDVTKKRPFYFGVLTWYMDRLMELVHDDLDAYREFLAVVHLVKPPAALMTPKIAGRVLGKWARTRLSGRKTLIASNYATGQHRWPTSLYAPKRSRWQTARRYLPTESLHTRKGRRCRRFIGTWTAGVLVSTPSKRARDRWWSLSTDFRNPGTPGGTRFRQSPPRATEWLPSINAGSDCPRSIVSNLPIESKNWWVTSSACWTRTAPRRPW